MLNALLAQIAKKGKLSIFCLFEWLMRKLNIFLVAFLFVILASTIFSQQIKKPRVKPKVSLQTPFYDEKFDLSLLSLPPNFKGHDPDKIYDLLFSRLANLKRGEFEGISEFLDRYKKEEIKPLVGGLTINDVFAFTFTPETISYEMLNQAFIINFKTNTSTPSCSDAMRCALLPSLVHYGPAIQWREVFTNKGSYIGQNAFGASREIKITMLQKGSLIVSKDEKCELLSAPVSASSYLPTQCFPVSFYLPMKPSKAAIEKNDLRFFVAGHIIFPYVSEIVNLIEPTLDFPFKAYYVYNNLHFKPKVTGLYNIRTGEIINRREFKE